MATFPTWGAVQAAAEQRPGASIRVDKGRLPHPLQAGAHRSHGLPVGQVADFRWQLADCRGLHVHEFAEHYAAHIDQVDPSCNIFEHIRRDTPGLFVVGAAKVGATVGVLLGRSLGGMLLGAAMGAALGLVAVRIPGR